MFYKFKDYWIVKKDLRFRLEFSIFSNIWNVKISIEVALKKYYVISWHKIWIR